MGVNSFFRGDVIGFYGESLHGYEREVCSIAHAGIC